MQTFITVVVSGGLVVTAILCIVSLLAFAGKLQHRRWCRDQAARELCRSCGPQHPPSDMSRSIPGSENIYAWTHDTVVTPETLTESPACKLSPPVRRPRGGLSVVISNLSRGGHAN